MPLKNKTIRVAAILLVTMLVVVAVFFKLKPKGTPTPQPFQYSFKKVDSNLKGYILLSPYEIYFWRFGQIIIIDNLGNIHFQRQIYGPVFCFKQWKINGETLYSYIVNDPEVYHVPLINLSAGHIVLLDSALNEIKQIKLQPFNDINTNRNEGLDLHDFILLSKNHYITITAFEKIVTNIPDSLHPTKGVKVVAPIIQEIINDKVIWQWDGSMYPEFYTVSTEQNHFAYASVTHNYMHINSIFLDPRDSNLICSFRNTNQILKINRKSGAIVWRLGGKNSDFPLTNEQFFLKQHDVKLIDSNTTYLLFDNGDSATRQKSRILEFKLDEPNKKIIAFNAFDIPEKYSQYMGSVDKIGDNYFICGGSSFYLIEIKSKTGEKLMEMTNNQAIYRAAIINNIDGIKNSTLH